MDVTDNVLSKGAIIVASSSYDGETAARNVLLDDALIWRSVSAGTSGISETLTL